ADGHAYLAQNWDQDLRIQDHSIVIEAKLPGQPTMLYLTEAGILARSGLNDAGFGITGNALSSNRELRDGFGIPVSVVRRRVMMQTEWEAALAEVSRPSRSHSNNHLVVAADGRALDLETTPGEIFVVEPDDGIL